MTNVCKITGGKYLPFFKEVGVGGGFLELESGAKM